jgi:hypothetical protein
MSKGDLQYNNANEFRKYVDGTLSESESVTGIRNHKMNKNYEVATGRQGMNRGNFRNNNNSSGNKYGNKNFKYKK